MEERCEEFKKKLKLSSTDRTDRLIKINLQGYKAKSRNIGRKNEYMLLENEENAKIWKEYLEKLHDVQELKTI